MTDVLKRPVEPQQNENMPGWVIDHIISLCEFAAGRGMAAFEEKLSEATEVLLEELRAKILAPCTVPAPDTSKVVFFPTESRAFAPGATPISREQAHAMPITSGIRIIQTGML